MDGLPKGMQEVKIQNLSHPLFNPIQATSCESFFCRLRGLTFRRNIQPGEGLLLIYKRDDRLETSIHMLGVLIDLAVVWINSVGEVVDVRRACRWHLAYFPKRPARYVLEMAIEHLNDFHVGDRVSLEA